MVSSRNALHKPRGSSARGVALCRLENLAGKPAPLFPNKKTTSLLTEVVVRSARGRGASAQLAANKTKSRQTRSQQEQGRAAVWNCDLGHSLNKVGTGGSSAKREDRTGDISLTGQSGNADCELGPGQERIVSGV